MVDAIVAYRIWIPVPEHDNVFLKSCYTTMRWKTDRPMKAHCQCAYRHRPGTATDVLFGPRKTELHTCGIYAHNHPSHCELFGVLAHAIVGEVLLWGTVHVHERGYRAEYAQISAIYTRESSSTADKMFNELAASTYNVPLVAQ